jgi:hypothetical protein
MDEHGDVWDAEGRDFFMTDGFGDECIRAINVYDDLLDTLKAIDRYNDHPARFDKHLNDLIQPALALAEGKT